MEAHARAGDIAARGREGLIVGDVLTEMRLCELMNIKLFLKNEQSTKLLGLIFTKILTLIKKA